MFLKLKTKWVINSEDARELAEKQSVHVQRSCMDSQPPAVVHTTLRT